MNNFKKILSATIILVICFCFVLLYLFISVPREQIDLLANGYVSVSLNKDNQPIYHFSSKKPVNWASYDQISKPVRDAIVVSEDWSFYNHHGVDYNQVEHALKDKMTKGKKLRGASTISQQLVKNLFYSNERSFWRKAKEYFSVSYLEKKLNKKKILESYLNIIEYGKNTYGIKSASAYYFKKKPKQLSAKEGAFLAMLLPNPIRNSQSFRDKSLTKYGRTTISHILKKMKQAKFINKDEFEREESKTFNWILDRNTNNFPASRDKVDPKVIKRDRMRLNSKKIKKEILVFKHNKKRRKYKKKKKVNYEKQYRKDIEIDVDDNPNFDDDAIKENIGGIKEEFSL